MALACDAPTYRHGSPWPAHSLFPWTWHTWAFRRRADGQRVHARAGWAPGFPEGIDRCRLCERRAL